MNAINVSPVRLNTAKVEFTLLLKHWRSHRGIEGTCPSP